MGYLFGLARGTCLVSLTEISTYAPCCNAILNYDARSYSSIFDSALYIGSRAIHQDPWQQILSFITVVCDNLQPETRENVPSDRQKTSLNSGVLRKHKSRIRKVGALIASSSVFARPGWLEPSKSEVKITPVRRPTFRLLLLIVLIDCISVGNYLNSVCRLRVNLEAV